jgi:acyl-CoA reductase-like NAD-dependent aldehyde dehydrogenase
MQVAFSGTKASGSGWKEHGLEALEFFSERKAVQILSG